MMHVCSVGPRYQYPRGVNYAGTGVGALTETARRYDQVGPYHDGPEVAAWWSFNAHTSVPSSGRTKLRVTSGWRIHAPSFGHVHGWLGRRPVSRGRCDAALRFAPLRLRDVTGVLRQHAGIMSAVSLASLPKLNQPKWDGRGDADREPRGVSLITH